VDARCAPAYYGRGQIRGPQGASFPSEGGLHEGVEIDPSSAKGIWSAAPCLRPLHDNEPGAMAGFHPKAGRSGNPAYTLAWFQTALLRLSRKEIRREAVAD